MNRSAESASRSNLDRTKRVYYSVQLHKWLRNKIKVVVVHPLQNTQNLVDSGCQFEKQCSKIIYKN